MKKNNLRYYHGAIVEVMENYGNGSIIKIKGGAKLRVESAQLLDTDETKTRLPEWIAVGACAYLDGDILTITKVGNTQYEATGIKYSTHQGAINYLLHNGRAVVECDTDREPIQRPADYDKLTNITVNDIHIDTDNLFELMTTANDAGADDLAAYIHGLMCSGNQPDPDTITELIDGLLWTLQEEVDDCEAEAEEVREKIEKTKAEGYEVYIDSYDDTSDPATIQNAKKLFNEDIADNLNHLDCLYNNYIYPALSRLRAFVAAFSTDGATTDDPAQCAMDFETVADAAPAAEPVADAVADVVEAPAEPVADEVETPAEPVAAHCVALAVVPVSDAEPAPAPAASRAAADIDAELSAAVIRCYYSSMQAQAAPLPPVDAYDVETLTANAAIIRCRRRGRSVLVAVSGSEGINNFSYSAVCLETGSTLAHGCRCGADGGYNKIEAIQAGINAAIKQYFDAADVVADADSLAEQLPDPPAVVTVSAPYPPAPRRRRFAPRLRPVLRRLGRVAAVVLPLLIVAMFIGASTDSTASAHAADAAETVAQVVELPAVTVTAAAVTDAPAAPSPVKKLATPSPVKNAAADAVTLPGQKNASDIATATAPAADNADSLTTAPVANGLQPTPPDGLTVCPGTPWAYTMMNWA